nr:MAG TPA: hypothetical protein [Caudoviricetes sp.]
MSYLPKIIKNHIILISLTYFNFIIWRYNI